MKFSSIACNVDSTTGDVEPPDRTDIGARATLPSLPGLEALAPKLLLLIAITLLSACVETAECNATVSCPSEQVCYEYQCRETCQTRDECADGESCVPCMSDGAAGGEGKCFGEELDACIPEVG